MSLTIVDVPSGYHGPRRRHGEIDLVVLHAIGEWVVDATNIAGQGKGWLWHCTDFLRAIGRSTHAFVLPDALIVREVDSWFRARHARGHNSRSVGLEVVLRGVWPYHKFQAAMRGERDDAAYTPAQIRVAEDWVRARAIEHDFRLTEYNVRTHQQLDPDRKLDPGEIFPFDDFLAAVID